MSTIQKKKTIDEWIVNCVNVFRVTEAKKKKEKSKRNTEAFKPLLGMVSWS